MFYYYGRKKQLAKHYPSPNFKTIVEPFAGAAAYSLHGDNWRKNVLLIEKDERVADVWDWIISEATPDDFKKMPDLEVGEKTDDFLHIVHAATKMAFHYKTIKVTSVLARNWEISKRVMARNLHKVKHWEIMHGGYREAPDIEATWFIDPPYKGDSGKGYKHGSDQIDYDALARWVRERRGEVICCEGESGDYLPFERLRDSKSVAGKSSKERVYYRSNVSETQYSLFD